MTPTVADSQDSERKQYTYHYEFNTINMHADTLLSLLSLLQTLMNAAACPARTEPRVQTN